MDKLPQINKKIITVTSLDNIEEEKQFWLSKTPLERIEAIEINRRMVYGKTRTTSRLQRILEVAKLTEK
ncbi:hypothetical protein KAS42_02260 [bacterium]|nr:hypothetical protein [bacterium]